MEDSSQEYILKVSQPLLFGEWSTIVSNVVRRLSQGILYIIDIAKKTNRKTTFVQFIFIIRIQPISIMIIVVNCMPAHEYFRQMTLQQFLCKKRQKMYSIQKNAFFSLWDEISPARNRDKQKRRFFLFAIIALKTGDDK